MKGWMEQIHGRLCTITIQWLEKTLRQWDVMCEVSSVFSFMTSTHHQMFLSTSTPLNLIIHLHPLSHPSLLLHVLHNRIIANQEYRDITWYEVAGLTITLVLRVDVGYERVLGLELLSYTFDS